MVAAAAAPFLRFCLVGGLGFVIDAGALALLVYGLGADPMAARALSFLVAATATWATHRRFTFRVAARPSGLEWLRFVLANGAGGLLNLGVYSALLLGAPPPLGLPLPAVVVASAVAVVFNYTASRRLVFR